MPVDPQRKLQRMDVDKIPGPKPTPQQSRTAATSTIASYTGPTPTAQPQIGQAPPRPSTVPAAKSSNSPGPASTPSHKVSTVPRTKTPNANPILRTELESKHPTEYWFDSYYSLDKKLYKTLYRNNRGNDEPLANLPIPLKDKNGRVRHVGLRNAVWKQISDLLDEDAILNPVTRIPERPQGTSQDLWNGALWLGGIKDSVNVTKVLVPLDISAVVSIHPVDWLWNETCGKLFHNMQYTKPDGVQPQIRDKVVKQYVIHLADDSSSDLLAEFGKAFKFMDQYLLEGKNVLVHCKMGQSRSASLVLGYMISRYYETHVKTPRGVKLPADAQPKASKDLVDLEGRLTEFTTEIKMRRKGVSTKNFGDQLSQYIRQLVKPNRNDIPRRPTSAVKDVAQKKAGGGIIKDASLALCFIYDLVPTQEILGYWSSRKDTNKHYWAAAIKKKEERKGVPVQGDLASFNKFFEEYLTARA
jgi:hypothetical protein